MNRLTLTVLASAAALAALALTVAPAQAATTTANVNVQAIVNASCKMTDALVDFGTYDPTLAGNNDSGVGSLSVTCTKGTTGTITLAGAAGRSMTSATTTDSLPYELYSDSGRSTLWAGATSVAVPASTGVAQSVSVFGRITPGHYVAPGNYSAVVVATLNF
jgi:spore coat protein U-like protein